MDHNKKFKYSTTFDLSPLVIDADFKTALKEGEEESKVELKRLDEFKAQITHVFWTNTTSPIFEARYRVSKILDCLLLTNSTSTIDCLPHLHPEPALQLLESHGGTKSLHRTGQVRQADRPLRVSSLQLKSLPSTYEKLQQIPEGSLIQSVLNYLRLGFSHYDEYVTFMFVWIGFNALYNHVSSKLGYDDAKEWEKIVLFSQSIQSPQASVFVSEKGMNTAVINDLIRRDLKTKSRSRDINHSENLEKSSAASNHNEALKSALLCLYSLRNAIMHGSFLFEEERKWIEMHSLFLANIVRYKVKEIYDKTSAAV